MIGKIRDKSKCWWCNSIANSKEHKIKRTEIDLLYGGEFNSGNHINLIKYRTNDKSTFIQGPKSDRLKFNPNLCSNCNGSRSQKFDVAYQRLIEYYYRNQLKIITSGRLNYSEIFSKDWIESKKNVIRYIAKHVGCRMSELGYQPSIDYLDFLNGSDFTRDLFVYFQIKPYRFPADNHIEPIENIFIGPFNPINNSQIKETGIVTSFSGWYTFVNFSWNFIYEEGINKSKNTYSNIDELDIVNYPDDLLRITINKDSFETDWGKGLERIEYFPFVGNNRDIDHYNYLKKKAHSISSAIHQQERL